MMSLRDARAQFHCRVASLFLRLHRDEAAANAYGMRDALNRQFDVVLAESLDRFSRDQEDTAGLFKRLTFAGVNIVTLVEGDITQPSRSVPREGRHAGVRPPERRQPF